jgi:uncharacterized protein YegJ (DUF2314 family)
MGSYSWLNQRFGEHAGTNRPAGGATATPINRAPPEPPPLSLVLLLRRPRRLDAASLAGVVSEAFGVPAAAGVDGPAAVVGESPHFLLHLAGRVFALHNVARPYFDNAAAVAAELPDLRLRKAVARHRAWLAVDLLYAGAEASGDPEQAVGKLAAALADGDCLAVCVPAQRQIYAYDEGVPAKLRGPDPLGALEARRPAPVIGVAANDPRLLAAVQEARRRWPEFVEAFEQRHGEQIFSVKVPLREGRVTEHMWVSVSALENDMIYGRLDNEPVEVKRLKAGDRVRVPVRELSDWLYTRGEVLAGGFTIDVLARAARRPKRP